MKRLLPIGSVISLKELGHRVMIYGRIQKDTATGVVYDYAGCFYPEGIQDTNNILLFNEEDIKALFFVGFQDFEELAYRQALQQACAQNEGSD